MIRHAAAVAITLCLSPAWLYAQTAQTTVLTVNTASADVYVSPSTGSAVIGHAANGTVLEVTRELGSWVKVSWPGAKDGAGYVHVSKGLLGHPSTTASQPAGVTAGSPVRPTQEPATVTPVATERSVSASRVTPTLPVYVTPSTHVFGLGARAGGPTVGFGATARAWSRKRIGMQLDLSHYSPAATEAGRTTAMRFDPSVTYSLPDSVTDYLWVRPYVGSGLSLQHQTFSGSAPGAEASVSENNFGLQFFGGGELTFPGMPRFALSVDLGYHHLPTPSVGVDLGGIGTFVSAHWYVK